MLGYLIRSVLNLNVLSVNLLRCVVRLLTRAVNRVSLVYVVSAVRLELLLWVIV